MLVNSFKAVIGIYLLSLANGNHMTVLKGESRGHILKARMPHGCAPVESPPEVNVCFDNRRKYPLGKRAPAVIASLLNIGVPRSDGVTNLLFWVTII